MKPVTVRRHLVRMVAGTLVALVALVVTAPAAAAHNVLIDSDPPAGAVLDTQPAAVTLTFDQAIKNLGQALEVIGPNGNSFVAGPPEIIGAVISAPIEAGPAGEYRVSYRIVSADGHPVQDQYTYTLTEAGAGPATGTPVEQRETDNGAAVLWLWISIGVVVVAMAGIAVGITLRRRGL